MTVTPVGPRRPLRVLYVAKHDPKDNQDELAISHALGLLGHSTVAVHEHPIRRSTSPSVVAGLAKFDFCLFHKWEEIDEIKKIAQKMPVVFWNFDQVASPDLPESWVDRRTRWMAEVTPLSTLGFLTDGDWVEKDTSGKLRWLTQGADERVTGLGEVLDYSLPPLVFMGSYRYSQKRTSHVAELKHRYGELLEVFGETPRLRKHGRDLANYLAGRLVISLDGSQTDKYWSNRVYLVAGFGGFLIHPYCEELTRHYKDADREGDNHLSGEVVYYKNRDRLLQMIDFWLQRKMMRDEIAKAAHERTMKSNLYRHRVAHLISEVRTKL